MRIPRKVNVKVKDYLTHNQFAWDKQVENKNQWTIPVSSEVIAKARKGMWQVLLTPWKPVPSEWFPDLKGIDVLCLASAGGQQAPIFAAAGANVVVFDISPKQLEQDKKAAIQNNLQLKTVVGDMADLSKFSDESFDLIFHPVSNCFIRDVNPVWREANRVLKPNGIMLAGFANPVLYLFDESKPERETKLEVVNKIPYSDLESLSDSQKEEYVKNGYPFEFGHSLDDLIGGQLKAGFIINGFYEDKHHSKEHPIYNYIPTFLATRAVKSKDIY